MKTINQLKFEAPNAALRSARFIAAQDVLPPRPTVLLCASLPRFALETNILLTLWGPNENISVAYLSLWWFESLSEPCVTLQ